MSERMPSSSAVGSALSFDEGLLWQRIQTLHHRLQLLAMKEQPLPAKTEATGPVLVCPSFWLCVAPEANKWPDKEQDEADLSELRLVELLRRLERRHVIELEPPRTMDTVQIRILGVPPHMVLPPVGYFGEPAELRMLSLQLLMESGTEIYLASRPLPSLTLSNEKLGALREHSAREAIAEAGALLVEALDLSQKLERRIGEDED